LRVLLHCVYYAPEVGGLESHVTGLATGLVRRGVEVRVVTSRSLPGMQRHEEVDGVGIIRTWLPSRSPAGWIAYALGSVPATRREARWADLVHAQSFASEVPVGIAASAARRPWVASFHTSHFLARARSPVWSPILGRLVRWPDHALAASAEIAQVATGLSGGCPVEALTNGVDTDVFRPAEGSQSSRGDVKTLVVPRRLFQKNGVEFLIRSLPEVRVSFPRLRVLIVGDGPERPRLAALSRALDVEAMVQFLGARPHHEMPSLFRSAEIAVFPSLMEATSVAALEAMSSGLPVVASAVGGLPEIVDREVGALVPPGDPAALAQAITRLLADDARSEKGLRARARVVAMWSNDRLVERHLEIYDDLVSGGPVRPARPENRSGSS
jgi:glycosyltransferase involved in cell wall biosynthesis